MLLATPPPWKYVRDDCCDQQDHGTRSIGLVYMVSLRCWRCWRCWPRVRALSNVLLNESGLL
eukprot:5022400-Amphidinium_carterae.2